MPRKVSTDALKEGQFARHAHLSVDGTYNKIWLKEPYWEDRTESDQMKWRIGHGNEINGWWTSEYWWVLSEEEAEGLDFRSFPAGNRPW